MWKCPICGNEEKKRYICQKCGYDVRCDFVRKRTIQPVPKKNVQIYNKHILDYKKVEQEKKAEKDLKRRTERSMSSEKIYDEVHKNSESDEKMLQEHEKKSSKGLKAAVIFMFFAILVPIGTMTLMESDHHEDVYDSSEQVIQDDLNKESISYENDSIDEMAETDEIYLDTKESWDTIMMASIEKLKSGPIDYTIQSQESMKAVFEQQGILVDYDMYESGSELSNAGGVIEIFDGNNPVLMEDYRRLEFFDDSQITDENNGENVILPFVPLPCDIEFGDSFDSVCDKLGIVPGVIDDKNIIFTNVTSPNSIDGYVSIQIEYQDASEKTYNFMYDFTIEDSRLYHYHVLFPSQ